MEKLTKEEYIKLILDNLCELITSQTLVTADKVEKYKETAYKLLSYVIDNGITLTSGICTPSIYTSKSTDIKPDWTVRPENLPKYGYYTGENDDSIENPTTNITSK